MKINQPGGHLDQMLRQTRHHHVQLSAMADMKANMLITVSSVLVTLSAPHILEPHFRKPVIVLAIFCLMTVALAVYTVMPKVPLNVKQRAQPDAQSPFFNLLFFGDFVRLDVAQFEAAMEEVMNDPSRCYQAQVREVYTLGLFLAKGKYRTLRLAYLTFILGLVTSGLTLFVGLKLH